MVLVPMRTTKKTKLRCEPIDEDSMSERMMSEIDQDIAEIFND